eukprot:s2747_g6.t1
MGQSREPQLLATTEPSWQSCKASEAAADAAGYRLSPCSPSTARSEAGACEARSVVPCCSVVLSIWIGQILVIRISLLIIRHCFQHLWLSNDRLFTRGCFVRSRTKDCVMSA